jgi:hypothetical protein
MVAGQNRRCQTWRSEVAALASLSRPKSAIPLPASPALEPNVRLPRIAAGKRTGAKPPGAADQAHRSRHLEATWLLATQVRCSATHFPSPTADAPPKPHIAALRPFRSLTLHTRLDDLDSAPTRREPQGSAFLRAVRGLGRSGGS